MGNKTHPVGFRLGVIKDWQTNWFAAKQKDYRELVLEDMRIRKGIFQAYPDGGISWVDIERGSSDVVITIHTARPGIVIGRGGQKVEELRKDLERLTASPSPTQRAGDTPARVGRIPCRPQHRRPVGPPHSVPQGDQAGCWQNDAGGGAQGVKVICSGRLGGADIARREKAMDGRVPLHTLRRGHRL